MDQSPYLEANNQSTSHEIPRLLQNPKVHYSVYKNPLQDPTLSQIPPVHNLTSYFPKIHSNIIFITPPRPYPPAGVLPSGFQTEILYAFLCSATRATCLAHLILLHWFALIIVCEAHKLQSSFSFVTVFPKYVNYGRIY
jgi:hypothetical protein